MSLTRVFACLVIGLGLPLLTFAADTESKSTGEIILQDDFDRVESDPAKEEVGNGWKTNSRSRAQGVKQVDLDGGAIRIVRADVADHGVSVVHEAEFQDAVIELRFQLGPKDDLGINIADPMEKSVHAGHICMAKVQLHQLEMVDLKTGKMRLESRQSRTDGKETAADKKFNSQKSKFEKLDLVADEWHHLQVKIVGDVMTVAINGDPVGSFQSEGIGHATKRLLRLAVNKNAWVDDVQITRLK